MTPESLAAVGLLHQQAGPVASITLNRPEVRNAQTPAMWRALAELGASLPEETRVVVVRGAGPSFSAGLDRTMLDPTADAGDVETVAGLLVLDDAEISATIDAYQQGFTFLRDPRFVSIAAVQGYAVGAGFQLALACDLRVVADDAQFAMLESSLGLVPDLTGTKPLVESVGYARALEICVTARMVGAAEAVAIGRAVFDARLRQRRGDRPGADRRTRGRAGRDRGRSRRCPDRCPSGSGLRDQGVARRCRPARPRRAAATGARGAGAPAP